jgi:hypothetical protein
MVETELELDDDGLWTAFGAARLLASAWHHRAHLRMAWLFLDRHPLDEAHVLMRVGIIRLNAFHGLVETPVRGYHETLTRFWLTHVASLRARDRRASSSQFVDVHAAGLGKEAVLAHYSRERVFGLRARAVFVEPDLAPLPSYSRDR